MELTRFSQLFRFLIVFVILTLMAYYSWKSEFYFGWTHNKRIMTQEHRDQNNRTMKDITLSEKKDQEFKTTKIPTVQKEKDMKIKTVNNPSVQKKFLLDNRYCLIPDLDPFENVPKDKQKVVCTGKPSITYTEGSYLRLNWTRIRNEYNSDFKYCEYIPVTREGIKSDFKFKYGNLSEKFDHDILVPPEHEYMKVNCYSKSEGLILTNFHATVAPKKDVEERCNILFEKHKVENSPKETFNVHMIGMDSTARLNSIRNLPKTRKFLLNDLQAFEMTGYNKVADNTFVNIIPLTMGKYVSEMGWEPKMRIKFDKYEFIWKNFSRAGYRTFFAGDAPTISAFVYAKPGFGDPPTDYYNRHLQLAMRKEESLWNSKKHCIGDKMETKTVLDYVTDYSRVFKNKPHFGFTFIAKLTHGGGLAAADDPYFEFLTRFKQEGHLENTVLIFFSDHGYRFGANRHSYRGKVEERLPMMFLVLPQKFHQKYPHLVKNLRTNSRRLTTPFDIYETVKDFLYFDGMERKANIMDRGISLLREIPKERNCFHTQIPHHWCLCMEEKKLETEGELPRKIGEAAIRLINEKLLPEKDLCVELTLGNITSIVKKESNDKILRYDKTIEAAIHDKYLLGDKTKAPIIYQITFSALPSQALFEATLQYDSEFETFQFAGDVSRINAYGDQSRCLKTFKLKPLCLCK